MAKGDLLVDKFIELCKDVLVHNGYTVEKKILEGEPGGCSEHGANVIVL